MFLFRGEYKRALGGVVGVVLTGARNTDDLAEIVDALGNFQDPWGSSGQKGVEVNESLAALVKDSMIGSIRHERVTHYIISVINAPRAAGKINRSEVLRDPCSIAHNPRRVKESMVSAISTLRCTGDFTEEVDAFRFERDGGGTAERA